MKYNETTQNNDSYEETRRIRRRRQRRRQQRQRRLMIRRLIAVCVLLLLMILLFLAGRGVLRILHGNRETDTRTTESAIINAETNSGGISEDHSDSIADDAGTGETVMDAPVSGLPESNYTTGDGSARAASIGASQTGNGASVGLLSANPVLPDGTIQVGDVRFLAGYTANVSSTAAWPAESDVQSSHAVLIDESTGTIVAQKDADSMIYPASMTKILTILVAAEHVSSLDDTFAVTQEITDYAYKNGCSIVGFQVGEEVPIRDLFYGTILPSGADAALSLAVYTAGSHEAFVEWMNEKLTELGLSDSAHFTNCVGIYNDNHYCTTTDMAMILKAAVENDFCREVLTAHKYTTTPTAEHPDGIEISNWFLRRIEDKDSGGVVQSAKTGYVTQSGNCAASYEISDSGIPYICVTANAHSAWRCIYDHVAMYKNYAP
ncbi:MAG: serine hydrolase [Clostridiales bacterium]|nr:serine hydrolase [Clostridiales bacterium]